MKSILKVIFYSLIFILAVSCSQTTDKKVLESEKKTVSTKFIWDNEIKDQVVSILQNVDTSSVDLIVSESGLVISAENYEITEKFLNELTIELDESGLNTRGKEWRHTYDSYHWNGYSFRYYELHYTRTRTAAWSAGAAIHIRLVNKGYTSSYEGVYNGRAYGTTAWHDYRNGTWSRMSTDAPMW